MVGRDDKVSVLQVADFLERLDHPDVGRHAPVEGDRTGEIHSAAEIALEVPRHGVAEAGHDIVIGRGLLLEVYHVCLCEDRAAAGDARRVLGLEGERAKLILDRESQAARLLVEERPRPRRADRVHGEILHLEPAVLLLKHDQLGVLSPDLDDRTNPRLQLTGRLRLRDDLVDVGDREGPGQIPAPGARHGQVADGGLPVTGQYLPEGLQGGGEGAPQVADVALLRDGAAAVQDDDIDANGTDIQADGHLLLSLLFHGVYPVMLSQFLA